MANVAIPNAIVDGEPHDASKMNENFVYLEDFLETEVVHLDGTVAFTGVPSGPASDPTDDNELTRKAYVDAYFAAADDGLADAAKFRGRVGWDLSRTSFGSAASDHDTDLDMGAGGTENFDSDGFFTSGTTLTVPTGLGGLYYVSMIATANFVYDPTPVGMWGILDLYSPSESNKTIVAMGYASGDDATVSHTLTGSGLWVASAGSTLRVRVYSRDAGFTDWRFTGTLVSTSS